MRKTFMSGIEIDEDGCLWCEITLLKINPRKSFKSFMKKILYELCDLIKENGVLTPIIIKKNERNEFIVIAGARRLRAAKMAGLSRVPVQFSSIK